VDKGKINPVYFASEETPQLDVLIEKSSQGGNSSTRCSRMKQFD